MLVGVCSGFTGHAGAAGREAEGGAHGRARGHIYANSVLPLPLSLLLRCTTREDEDDRGSTRGRDPLPTSGRLVLPPEVGWWPLRRSFSLSLSLSVCLFLSSSTFSLWLSSSLTLSRARNETTAAAFPCRPRIACSRRVTTYTLSRWPERALPGALSRRVHEKFECAEIVSSGRARARLVFYAGTRTTTTAQVQHSTETAHGTARHSTVNDNARTRLVSFRFVSIRLDSRRLRSAPLSVLCRAR